MHDFFEERIVGAGVLEEDQDAGFSEEGSNQLNLDIGLQTPSSFTQTPSYIRQTPSGQTPGYLMRE